MKKIAHYSNSSLDCYFIKSIYVLFIQAKAELFIDNNYKDYTINSDSSKKKMISNNSYKKN